MVKLTFLFLTDNREYVTAGDLLIAKSKVSLRSHTQNTDSYTKVHWEDIAGLDSVKVVYFIKEQAKIARIYYMAL